MMTKPSKKLKQSIIVFCEGASEAAYIRFLKNEFRDVVAFRCYCDTDFFENAERKLKKTPTLRDYTDEIDEVWFFFDVEMKDREKWNQRIRIIQQIRKLRKRPNIRVRLLMTTGCLEYWLLLHYKKIAPPIQTDEAKIQILHDLLREVPKYQKGDEDTTCQIATQYESAMTRAKQILAALLQDGLPGIADSDARNEWLCSQCVTFSTVFEGIEHLQELQTP